VRSHYFDNLKFVLIFLVVLGHYLGRYRSESAFVTGLYLFTYLFHMPVFAFVSGFFSKTYSPRIKDISFILIPFLVFQLAYIAYYKGLGLKSGEWYSGWNIAVPFVQNWYLLSLLGWRLMSQCVKKWRHVFPLSLLLAVLIGYVPFIGWELSLSRTICFFPFFLVGMQVDEAAIDRVVKFKGIAALILVGLLAFAFALSFVVFNSANLIIWNAYYASPYNLPEQLVSGPVYRMGIYFLSLLSGVAFVALIPRREMWFTRLGMRTMSVYLLHNFFAFGLKKMHPSYEPLVTELMVFTCAVATTLLLSTEVVHRGFLYPFSAINRFLEKVHSSIFYSK
jgi:fucose 4-O-acetylase-like acetyltransferase